MLLHRAGWTLSLAALLVFVPLASGSGQPRPGVLDPTFGNAGIVTTGDCGGAFSGVLQPDGKIVAAGFNCNDFTLVRYNPDGSPDSTFGTGGQATTHFTPNSPDFAYAAALQPDGKIVAAGDNYADFELARYNLDGSLDASFGAGGKVTTAMGYPAGVEAMAIEPDGKIVVAGFKRTDSQEEVVLARYTPDGSLDPDFGTGGVVTSGFVGNPHSYPTGLVIQPGGKIVVVGAAGDGTRSEFMLLRYLPDGSLDPSFGIQGRILTRFKPPIDSAYARAVVLQPDRKIVVAGYADSARPVLFALFALARYMPDGSLDRTFGTGGLVTTKFRKPGAATSVALQPDGKIIVGGSISVSYWDSELAVARYKQNGTLDAYFGSKGRVKTPFPTGEVATARAVLLQPNGKIVAIGGTDIHDIPATGFALARYYGGTLHCLVPSVTSKKLADARFLIRNDTHCVLGRITSTGSRVVPKGRVISERPRAHTTHPAGTKVNLVVSKGKRR